MRIGIIGGGVIARLVLEHRGELDTLRTMNRTPASSTKRSSVAIGCSAPDAVAARSRSTIAAHNDVVELLRPAPSVGADPREDRSVAATQHPVADE